MSKYTGMKTSDCSSGCGTGEERSALPCPECGIHGKTVSDITPRHTLKKEMRRQFKPELGYNFCENPDCDLVYYSGQSDKVFFTDDLINRVTIKDDSPETPLCYCFKVLKKHAMEEIARTGTTDVVATIRSRMGPDQSCFCQKSNPRGACCLPDVEQWMQQQGLEVTDAGSESKPEQSCCD